MSQTRQRNRDVRVPTKRQRREATRRTARDASDRLTEAGVLAEKSQTHPRGSGDPHTRRTHSSVRLSSRRVASRRVTVRLFSSRIVARGFERVIHPSLTRAAPARLVSFRAQRRRRLRRAFSHVSAPPPPAPHTSPQSSRLHSPCNTNTNTTPHAVRPAPRPAAPPRRPPPSTDHQHPYVLPVRIYTSGVPFSPSVDRPSTFHA